MQQLFIVAGSVLSVGTWCEQDRPSVLPLTPAGLYWLGSAGYRKPQCFVIIEAYSLLRFYQFNVNIWQAAFAINTQGPTPLPVALLCRGLHVPSSGGWRQREQRRPIPTWTGSALKCDSLYLCEYMRKQHTGWRGAQTLGGQRQRALPIRSTWAMRGGRAPEQTHRAPDRASLLGGRQQ